MSGDRELLELAAKAAGIEVAWHSSNQPVRLEAGGPFGKVAAGFWNPLIDDGEALRLAVKLGMHLQFDHEELNSIYVFSESPTSVHQPSNGDPYTATRRAIVMAAAEIGKAKP